MWCGHFCDSSTGCTSTMKDTEPCSCTSRGRMKHVKKIFQCILWVVMVGCSLISYVLIKWEKSMMILALDIQKTQNVKSLWRLIGCHPLLLLFRDDGQDIFAGKDHLDTKKKERHIKELRVFVLVKETIIFFCMTPLVIRLFCRNLYCIWNVAPSYTRQRVVERVGPMVIPILFFCMLIVITGNVISS
jgi:hypothetical protein